MNLIERLSCPVCGERETSSIYAEPYDAPKMVAALEAAYISRGAARPTQLAGETYELLRCAACHFVFQKFVPSEAFAEQLYGEWIDGHKLFENKFSKYPLDHFDRVNRVVRGVLALSDKRPRDIRFLDFGMGWGDSCAAAKGYGADVTGVELAHEKIAYAKSRGIHSVPSADGKKFDIVFSNQVLEHLTNPVGILRHFKTLLATDGLIYVAVPNGGSLCEKAKGGVLDEEIIRPYRKLVAPLEHINVFSAETLTRAGREAGLVQRDCSLMPPWKLRTLPQIKGRIFQNLGLARPTGLTAVFAAT